jgi:hypothetical protein
LVEGALANPGEIHLIVSDSGTGFDIEAARQAEVWALQVWRNEFGWSAERSPLNRSRCVEQRSMLACRLSQSPVFNGRLCNRPNNREDSIQLRATNSLRWCALWCSGTPQPTSVDS